MRAFTSKCVSGYVSDTCGRIFGLIWRLIFKILNNPILMKLLMRLGWINFLVELLGIFQIQLLLYINNLEMSLDGRNQYNNFWFSS